MGSLNTGGAENLVLDLARYVCGKENPTVEFHAAYMHDSLPERVELFSEAFMGRVIHIPCGKGLPSTFRFVRGLRRYIKSNCIEEIHCHNNVDAYWAYFASVSTSVKKIILSVHGLNLNFRFLAEKMGGFSKLEKHILHRLHIKYVSGVARDFYLSGYGWRELEGEVVYNGIEWNRFLCAQKCNPCNEPWLMDARPVFLMAGSFNPQSRLQGLVCRALAILGRETPLPFKFVFAGARNPKCPQLYDDCVSFCREKGMLEKDVFFLGVRMDVPSLMSSVQGYVYASECDTFGLSAVEAAGCGLPVLCSDIPALREVLQDGKFGRLVANDEEVFAKEMLSLYAQLSADRAIAPDKIDVRDARARQIRQMYSIGNCFEGYYGTNH